MSDDMLLIQYFNEPTTSNPLKIINETKYKLTITYDNEGIHIKETEDPKWPKYNWEKKDAITS